MWITKIIGVSAQLCIIILAILLVCQFSAKQIYDGRIDNIERTLNAKIDDNKKYLNDKITIQQDNVNRYIQLREDRAKLYSARIDELYALYKKNPDPVDKANTSVAQIVADVTVPTDVGVADSNLYYLESKINKVSETSDNRFNRLDSKVSVLEQKISLLQTSSPLNVKVIQNNLQTVNTGK